MTKIKKMLVALPITALLLGIVTVPVYANEGEDSSGSTSTSDSSGSGDASKAQDATNGKPSSGRQTEEKLRNKGQELLKHAKEQKQQKEGSAAAGSQDESVKAAAAVKERRQKRCENRKHGLETKVANIVTVAQKHKTRIDEVYAKALAYQKDKNITVENFDTLATTADSAKSQAQASVDALTSLKPTIQCDSETVATDVATFKAAAGQARADLKAYRASVKTMLTTLKAARGEQ
ncbi:MAG TPA: hypothetical protein VLA92_01425 [Candidatus Saccharimonadales bacterium]|nr:hypothetical protein [Candidatus Saccharimonadales bacterium]